MVTGSLSENMQPGDSLLLGTDLVKDVDRLVRAYDDSAGVTARFNKNVLAVVNRELDADFDLTAFAHVARWNADEERIEMWLRARSPQRVHGRTTWKMCTVCTGGCGCLAVSKPSQPALATNVG